MVSHLLGACVSSCGGRGWFLWALVIVCGLLHPLHTFVAIVRWLWCCVGQLLSFLDGWDHVKGCGLSEVTWEQHCGEVDVGCHWAVG